MRSTHTTPGSTRTPHAVGDTFKVLHDSPGNGTVLAPLKVQRVTRMNDPVWRWRLTFERYGKPTTCPTVEVTVNDAGRDRHGYVEKVRTDQH